MKIQFLGATGTVTGSKYLLTNKSGAQLLVDCGLFQGLKNLREKNWTEFPADIDKISALVLTHAHIDHSGYIPKLFKDGYRNEIYCTHGTRALAGILLIDSARIQEEEAQYANKKQYSKHNPALALYSEMDALASLALFRTKEFAETFEVDGFKIKFYKAGHILGAASVLIESDGQKILFSGDLGRNDDLLMLPPHLPVDADYVVMESTYGNRIHPPLDAVSEFKKLVDKIRERKSVLLVPSFAVGRAQTIILILHKLFELYPHLRVPIYLNSPMAKEVTELYTKFTDDHKLNHQQTREIFGSVKIISSIDESKQLNQGRGPMIIISASGMLTGGRILHHLEAYGEDPRNILLLPGFQAEGTRGYDIAHGERRIKFHGIYHQLNLEVEQFDFLSAHADQEGLLNWLKAMPRKPKRVFITHGEAMASDTLRKRVEEDLHFSACTPVDKQLVELH